MSRPTIRSKNTFQPLPPSPLPTGHRDQSRQKNLPVEHREPNGLYYIPVSHNRPVGPSPNPRGHGGFSPAFFRGIARGKGGLWTVERGRELPERNNVSGNLRASVFPRSQMYYDGPQMPCTFFGERFRYLNVLRLRREQSPNNQREENQK